jgi:hypothetical protein
MENKGGSEFEFWLGQEFSLLRFAQTGSGAHPTSYPMDTGALPSRIKQPGREADHSPPTSAEVKKTWVVHPLLLLLHGVVLNQINTGRNLT